MTEIHTIGLIADDLTGASDTAVQFVRRGWKMLLTLERGQTPVLRGQTPVTAGGSDPLVLAVTTDARALDAAAAEKRTSDALARLIDAGIDRIYLKIDSTMRGSVSGQIAGALAVWRRTYPNASAVVCPAYPRMGRTTTANRVLVDGRPVERSAIGLDPVTPVTTSDLAALIPGSRHVALDEIANSSAPDATREPAPIFTVDARSDEDLAMLASAIAAAGPSAIPVGSAGLAGAMAAVWSEGVQPIEPVRVPGAGGSKSPRILMQMTSLHPVSRAQIAKLAEVCPDVVVLSGLAEQVAETFADLVDRERWDVLGLIGGDGARAALGRLDASAIRIVDAVLEGIPLAIVVGGRADGMPIFTKAGGFGAVDALVRVVERLRA